MKNVIEDLLTKNCRYIDIQFKNGGSINVYKPNQEDGNLFEFVNDTLLKNVIRDESGCVYEYYFEIDNISYISSTYDCPELV